MFKIFRLIIYSILTILLWPSSAGAQNKLPKQVQDDCNCGLAKNLKAEDWRIAANGDVVVICNQNKFTTITDERGVKTYPSPMAMLKQNTLYNTYEKIVLCGTGKFVPILNSGEGYSLTYRENKLYITWRMAIDSFEVSKKQWTTIYRPISRQFIAAKQGTLFLSANALSYKPQKILPQMIAMVNKQYLDEKKRANDHYFDTSLAMRLFVLASSGHQLSKSRLLSLEQDFKAARNDRVRSYVGIFKGQGLK